MEKRDYVLLLAILAVLLIFSWVIGGYTIKSNPTNDGKVWVEVSVFPRCQTDPWIQENEKISDFFSSNGIPIYDTRISQRLTCASCDCPSPYKTEILITSFDKLTAARILAQYVNFSCNIPTNSSSGNNFSSINLTTNLSI